MGLAYERLTDRCQSQPWDVELSHGKLGWELEVRDSGELLARSRSSMGAPEVFDKLAVRAVLALKKQQR